jgi:hypothetical protein
MNFSDEILMAFADGEVDDATRAAIEQAMRDDPAIAAKVAQHRALRADVFAAFSSMLNEPVPEHLQAATRPLPKTATLLQMEPVRVQRAEKKVARRWPWPQVAALAASLMVGVLAGRASLTGAGQDASAEANIMNRGGMLVAQGRLATVLSQQLASAAPSDARMRVGVSFLSKQGNYCRSFTLGGSAGGLACRSGKEWTVPVFAENDAGATTGEYRQASSSMPSAVLQAIDQRMSGQTLNAKAEKEAQERGWQP